MPSLRDARPELFDAPGKAQRDRLFSDLVTGDVMSLGVGPLDLDVEMAKKHGWTNEMIISAFFALGALTRESNRIVAMHQGYRYLCPNCECWTATPPLECHLCAADEARAKKSHPTPAT